jgi:hypothetical protein
MVASWLRDHLLLKERKTHNVMEKYSFSVVATRTVVI